MTRQPAGRLPRLCLRAQPDSRLVTLAREGHEAAYEEIVRRYREPLVRFAGTIVPPHLAEDTVQEGLVRAHRALLEGDAEITLRAWLYTIVRNGAVSERRRIRPTEQLDETINGVPQPPDVFERRERVRGVVAELKRLPKKQREAIVRTELEGASGEEIAESLATTPGAVSQLVFRARSAVRSGLAIFMPMPLVRLALNAPPGAGSGGTAASGALAGALGGGGGGAAIKLGAAVVVAAIAIGPARAPLENDGNEGGVVEIEGAQVGDGKGRGGNGAAHDGDTQAESEHHGSSGSGSQEPGTGGGGEAGGADGLRSDSGVSGAGDSATTATFTSGGGGDAESNGGGEATTTQPEPPPDGGGGHHGDGDHITDGAPPPPDSDGGYDGGTYDGGGDHHGDGHQLSYDQGGFDGQGDNGGHHDGFGGGGGGGSGFAGHR